MPPTQLSLPLKSHFEDGDSLRIRGAPFKVLLFSPEFDLLASVNSPAIFRHGTHKPLDG